MRVIRPIQLKDLEEFEKVAIATGSGMTSVPKARKDLQDLIEFSSASFAKELKKPINETYLFVLEDLETKQLAGICAIYSKTGVNEPVYFYRIEKIAPPPTTLPTPKYFTLLKPTTINNGHSELCSLFMMPNYRHEGLGKLLSFSRLLFIASHPHRFENTLYAELRGYIDARGKSPFWCDFGSRFLNLTFEEINSMLNGRRNFFPEGLPAHPIYSLLLSKAAQKAIGRTHDKSKPAIKMLMSEGFAITDFINPIDGGPIVEAPVASLRTVCNSQVAVVHTISEPPLKGKSALIANLEMDYRCAQGKVQVLEEGKIALEKDVAIALKVNEGKKVRYI